MNAVTLFGRIQTTPELLYLIDTAIVTFVFTTFKHCDDPELAPRKVTFHHVKAYGPLAEDLARHVPGTTLLIRGELNTRFIGTAEEPRVDATVIASKVHVYPAYRFENAPTIEALAAQTPAV